MAGSGVLRKQYKALAELVDDFGVEFDTPPGSFNQKFCALCKLAIDDLGGTFTPVKGGDFTARKASYLWQLAKALGLSIEDRQGSANLMLASAKTIFNDYNDGTRPDIGSSLDWRVFQYLNHAIGGPPTDDLIQYVLKTLYDSDSSEWPDDTDNDNVLLNANSNCITLNGADQYGQLDNVTTAEGCYSISLWHKLDSSQTGINRVIWSFGGSAGRLLVSTDDGFRLTSTSPSIDSTAYWDEWHKYSATLDGTSGGSITSFSIDDTILWTGTSAAGVDGTFQVGARDGGLNNSGAFCDLEMCSCVIPISEGDGLTSYSTGVDDNGDRVEADITWEVGSGSTTVMWSGTQDEYHYNLLYGCSPVTTDDVTLYYPALSDGSDDVAGLGLTNPAGNWHNGAETYFIQDDANSSSAELLTRAIFSADGTTFDAFDFDEMWDYVNGTDNVFFLRKTISSAQRIRVILVYAYDKQFAASEWVRLQSFLSSDEGDSLVPAEVTAGTGIGPDLDWADNGDGEILLVTET